MPITFDRQDKGYLDWIDGHQHGYVVNTYRNPHPGYLRLHRASCGTISGTPARGTTWTDGDFVKVCSESIQELDCRARREANGTLKPCGL